MLERRQVQLAVAIAMSWAIPGAAYGQDDIRARTVDFQSGGVISDPLLSDATTIPGLRVGVRLFPTRSTWISAGISVDLQIDDGNPESIDGIPVLGIGIGAGLSTALGDRIGVFAGATGEWIQAWDWPTSPEACALEIWFCIQGGRMHGLRAGPTGSLSLLLGTAWGHPMSLELTVDYHWYWLAEKHRYTSGNAEKIPTKAWRGGLFLTGVLFPEPPY